MTALPPDLRARVLAAARSEPSPTAPVARRRAGLALVLGAAVSLVTFLALGGLHIRREMVVVGATGLGVALLAALATLGALGRGGSMVGRSRGALFGVATLAPVLFLTWSSLAPAFGSTGIQLDDGDPVVGHVICFGLTALYALAPFVAALIVRRGSDPVHPRALGAAIGAAAGAWGGLLIDVHCPSDAVLHLTVGHLAPIVLMVLVGAALGARVLGVRAR